MVHGMEKMQALFVEVQDLGGESERLAAADLA
jgi:hypothetical protein